MLLVKLMVENFPNVTSVMFLGVELRKLYRMVVNDFIKYLYDGINGVYIR